MRDELAKVMGFWLQLGLDGFRVDAVPFLLDTEGVDAQEAARLPDPHEYLRALRALVGAAVRGRDPARRGEPAATSSSWSSSAAPDGGELTMQFDFITMQRLYLSLARGDAGPVVEALTARPPMSPDSQWATFVRNHDELTLDKLTDAERQEVFAAFGPEETMQVYGRGLRRRLPPMLDGDPRRIRMVYSLLFSLPGTPVLFYGEEIGMGEDLDARGPDGGPHADAVDLRRATAGSPAPRRARLRRPVVERRLRAGVRQRRRPAARPRVAAVVHEAADPAVPGVARSSAGAS